MIHAKAATLCVCVCRQEVLSVCGAGGGVGGAGFGIAGGCSNGMS